MTGRPAIWLAVALALAAGIFVERAALNGRQVNTDIDRTDQDAYLEYAIALRDSDFSYVGRRNRMPLFPAVVGFFLNKGEAPAGAFPLARQINIALALVGMTIFGVVCWRRFPPHAALNALFVAAFTVFVFKAAYAQAEVLFYTLFFATFVACWRLFERPGFLLSIVAGLLFALAHLTKASVLPGLAVFVVCFSADALWRRRQAARSLAVVAVVGAVFLAVVWPYIQKSKAIYGRYFYNVNSTFYIWCDSWRDAESRTKAAGDRTGWPNLPPDKIPSLKNYLRTHDAAEIAGRFVHGVDRVVRSMRKSYGYFWFCVAYLVFAAWIAWNRRATLARVIRRRPMPAGALALFFGGYFLLIAWYSPIADGNRIVLSLLLPFLFATTAFAVRFGRRIVLRLPGLPPLRAGPVFHTAVSLWLLGTVLYNCLVRIPQVYGGS